MCACLCIQLWYFMPSHGFWIWRVSPQEWASKQPTNFSWKEPTETGMGRCMIQIYIYRIKRLGPHIFPTITSQCVMFPSETVENQFARKSSTMSLGGNGTGHIMKFKLLGKDLLELNMHGIYIYIELFIYLFVYFYMSMNHSQCGTNTCFRIVAWWVVAGRRQSAEILVQRIFLKVNTCDATGFHRNMFTWLLASTAQDSEKFDPNQQTFLPLGITPLCCANR